jgi:hypothetical protein
MTVDVLNSTFRTPQGGTKKNRAKEITDGAAEIGEE